jgi:catechol 2,3-dioxygenase
MKIEMGATELNVHELTVMKKFYQELVGLEILSESKSEVRLGYSEREILNLQQTPELQPASPGEAGLYHNAIVFESRAVLAQTIERILITESSYFVGSADHLVSEAFYFSDPEGNGLELYFDKDPDTWQWRDGKIVMTSIYIDPKEYIDSYSQLTDTPAKKMGHVHLKVGSISEAKVFYVDALGLTITAEMPGALFVSDGKYHHYLGMNVWESRGAHKRLETLGLKSFEIKLGSSQFGPLRDRLAVNKIQFAENGSVITTSDLWNNEIHFSPIAD